MCVRFALVNRKAIVLGILFILPKTGKLNFLLEFGRFLEA